MICDHPDCTGVHSTKRPASEWCPVMRPRKRQRERREIQTPGTYRYKAKHGIGRPGLVSQFEERRRHRRRANERDQRRLRGITET